MDSITVTDGIVSAVRQSRAEGYQSTWAIQTNAPISPGNSGGPLVDAGGRLVGINTFIMLEGQNVNGSIHVRELLTVLQQNDIPYRKAAPGFAGVLLVVLAVAAALGSVRWGGFSPGVLACAAAELALCCRAQKFAALSGSAVLGAALCAADPALAPAAAGLGCATAAAVVLAPGRRVETLAAYAGGCVSGVLCVQPPGNAFGLLFSACGGMAVHRSRSL